MQITTPGLTKAAGTAAAAAGAAFIAVQIGHPSFDTYLSQTTEWVVRCSVKTVMAVLALAGLTGIYVHQHRKAGLLGLVGYLVFAAGYLAMLATEVIAVFVLPQLVDSQPGFVNDVIVASGGGHPIGDIGGMQILFDLTGALYIVGGLLFGIALFRTGVLARWAAVLLAVSTVGTAALAVLPEAFDRPMAVPEGIALIGLGVSLWRTQRQAAPTTPAFRPVQQPAVR
jgi:peptidyl-tRNA hydrolase